MIAQFCLKGEVVVNATAVYTIFLQLFFLSLTAFSSIGQFRQSSKEDGGVHQIKI
jgi:hypothetical protein